MKRTLILLALTIALLLISAAPVAAARGVIWGS